MNSLTNDIKLSVQHFHQGNSTRNQRHGHPYITVAQLVRRVDEDTVEVLAEAKAMCSRHDRPKREVGYSLAVGRVFKKFMEKQ